jgi:hypothetical protein
MLHEQKKLVMNGETPRRAFRRPCSVRSSIQQVSHATDVKDGREGVDVPCASTGPQEQLLT